jgi:hypothetical protein
MVDDARGADQEVQGEGSVLSLSIEPNVHEQKQGSAFL